MKLSQLAATCAVFALAACGQTEAPEAEAPPAATDILSQVNAQPAEQRPVFAWQQLTAYQASHPEAQPPCTSIRRAEARGVVPEDVLTDSIYAGHVGATVYSIQCGPQLTTVRDNPAEHWLVIFTPGAAESTIVSCNGPRGDLCLSREIPRNTPATP
jgi:hypothetical protein